MHPTFGRAVIPTEVMLNQMKTVYLLIQKSQTSHIYVILQKDVICDTCLSLSHISTLNPLLRYSLSHNFTLLNPVVQYKYIDITQSSEWKCV